MSDSSSRNPGDPSSTARLTAKGRISKAKKGIRDFHICTECGKTYSRAEHLRRHCQSHEGAKLKCSWPRCRKVFSRNDLLRRHEQKHAETRQLPSSSPNPTTITALEREPSIAITTATAPSSSHAVGSGVHDGTVVIPLDSSATFLGNIGHSDIFTTLPEVKAEPGANTHASFSQLQSAPLAITSLPYTDLLDPWTQLCSQDFRPVYAPSTTIPFSNSWTDLAAATTSSVTTPQHHPWLAPTFESSAHSSSSSPLLHASMSSVKLNLEILSLDPFNSACGTLPYAAQNLTLEPSFHDHTLSQHLSQDARQNYLAAYWIGFDPLCSIIHRQLFAHHASNPLLEAAVLAVGAQYSDATFARSDSRLLYERCRDVIKKHTQSFAVNCSLANMQAIYLVEFLGCFRARRILSQPSEAFTSVSQQLWHQHDAYHPRSPTRTQLNLMLQPPEQTLSEADLQQRWHTWLLTHSYQRLHTACHILQAQQALLLSQPQTSQLELDAGFDLWFPIPVRLWSTSSAAEWLHSLNKFTRLTTIATCQAIDDIVTGVPTFPYDEFQSNAVIAVYAAFTANQSNEYASHTVEPLAAFNPENYPALRSNLSQSTQVQLQLEATRLAAHTPLKALLAVSGESWLLGQRLSSSAQEGSQILDMYKGQLQLWANSLHPSFAIASLLDNMAGSATDPVALPAAHQALTCAKRILLMSLDGASVPMFGSELALYYATLTLWALTYANVAPIGTDVAAETEVDRPSETEMTVLREFLGDAAPAMLTQSAVLPAESWRPVVRAALGHSIWLLSGGDAGKQRAGTGELLDGAIGVLGRLHRRGWAGGWFGLA